MPSGGILILLVLFLIFGGKSALTGLFQSGSGAGTGTYSSQSSQSSQGSGSAGSGTQGGLGSGWGSSGPQGLFGGTSGSFGSWLGGTAGSGTQSSQVAGNLGILNREVSPQAREKRTVLKGNGQDTVTIMVYMCGTDLESRAGMGTSDLTTSEPGKRSDGQVCSLSYTRRNT